MNRAATIGLLVLSHAFACAFGATQTTGYLTKRQFARAADDPSYRVSAHLDLDDPDRPPTSFEADVASLEKVSVPPTAGIVRLMGHLRGVDSHGKAQFAEAAKACSALDWPKCDDATLKAMRRLLDR